MVPCLAQHRLAKSALERGLSESRSLEDSALSMSAWRSQGVKNRVPCFPRSTPHVVWRLSTRNSGGDGPCTSELPRPVAPTPGGGRCQCDRGRDGWMGGWMAVQSLRWRFLTPELDPGATLPPPRLCACWTADGPEGHGVLTEPPAGEAGPAAPRLPGPTRTPRVSVLAPPRAAPPTLGPTSRRLRGYLAQGAPPASQTARPSPAAPRALGTSGLPHRPPRPGRPPLSPSPTAPEARPCPRPSRQPPRPSAMSDPAPLTFLPARASAPRPDGVLLWPQLCLRSQAAAVWPEARDPG